MVYSNGWKCLNSLCTSILSAPQFSLRLNSLYASIFSVPQLSLRLNFLCASILSTLQFSLFLNSLYSSLFSIPQFSLRLNSLCTFLAQFASCEMSYLSHTQLALFRQVLPTGLIKRPPICFGSTLKEKYR